MILSNKISSARIYTLDDCLVKCESTPSTVTPDVERG
jgi:hypothetical protein